VTRAVTPGGDRGVVRRCLRVLAALAGPLAAAPAAAQAPVPAGGEFQVNTYTPGIQSRPSVAADAQGDFVVVWESYTSSVTPYTLQGQRYSSSGAALGGQFQVNSHTANPYAPEVAADADGDFVVVWMSYGSTGDDTSGGSIQGRRFASDGTPLGDQFQVNAYTTSLQEDPAVAARSDGGFVVVWESAGSAGGDTDGYSIQGQRYASDGSPLGGQFQVNGYATDNQNDSSVAMDADGDFVVTWESYGSSGTDASGDSVQGQRYDSNGGPLGGQFQVNSYVTGYQSDPGVTMEPGGDFVVAWESAGSAGGDTSYSSVQARRFASDGTPQGGEFQVNAFTTSYQENVSVQADADGDFVVAWASAGSFGSDTGYGSSIQARRYASDGASLGGEFQVNTYTTDYQTRPVVASAGDGDFVIAWQSYGSAGSDPADSIQGQRFAVPEPSEGLLLATALGAASVLARIRSGDQRPKRET
jgi:hypothetical protein